MNDAQTWTAIGGMLAVLIAVMAMTTRSFGQVLDAKLDTVSTRIDDDFQAITRRLLDGPDAA